MLNTLFLPEIREMLAEGDRDGLRQFCEAIHPAGTAEFMRGLTSEEAWQVLQYADDTTRAEIFLYFKTERQLEIINTSCLLYTSPSPRDQRGSRMPSSA